MSAQADNRYEAPGASGRTSVRDVSGYAVFSVGEPGGAHVMAHRTLDAGHIELGHRQLGEWLAGRSGTGSEWVHLQFHMAVFELALGDWNAAYARFMDEMLPAAATTEDALTDAPALLWRLALAAPGPVELPWQPLRRTALRCLQRPSEPFVDLHNLLALAGAGDIVSIERWLETRPGTGNSSADRLVQQTAVALQAYATRTYQQAATLLRSLVPQLPKVGGSRAQNQLFLALEHSSWRHASDAGLEPLYAHAA